MLISLHSRYHLHAPLTFVLKVAQLHRSGALPRGCSVCWWMVSIVRRLCSVGREGSLWQSWEGSWLLEALIIFFAWMSLCIRCAEEKFSWSGFQRFDVCSFCRVCFVACCSLSSFPKHRPHNKTSRGAKNSIDVYSIYQITGHFHCKLLLILEGQPQSAEFTWFFFALSCRPFYTGQTEAAEHRALLQDWDQQPDGLQLSRCFPGQRWGVSGRGNWWWGGGSSVATLAASNAYNKPALCKISK